MELGDSRRGEKEEEEVEVKAKKTNVRILQRYADLERTDRRRPLKAYECHAPCLRQAGGARV